MSTVYYELSSGKPRLMPIVFSNYFPRLYLSLTALAVMSGPVLAQSNAQESTPENAPSILDRSPFLPPGFEPPRSSTQRRTKKPQPRKNYEFRGVYQLAGEYHFLVSEARSRDGDWVSLRNNKPDLDIEVRDYDPRTQKLTVFANNKVEELTLASVEANPTPMPVTGQPKAESASSQKKDKPTRRTIRPTRRSSSSTSDGSPPPPPAWLQKLRERAAERRAAAAEGSQPNAGNTGSVGSSGSGGVRQQGGSSSGLPEPPGPPPSGKPPTPKPDFVPPPPPENLEIPEPPPEVKRRILDSLSQGG